MKEIVKGEIAFVRILVPLLAGITAAYLYIPSATVFTALPIVAALLFAIFTGVVVFYKQVYNFRSRWVTGLIVNVLLVSLGYLLTAYKSQKRDELYFSRLGYDALVATIQSEPRTAAGGIIRFESEVSVGLLNEKAHPVVGRMMLAIKDPLRQFHYGDQLLIPARYTEVAAPLNPAEFDYKAYLADHHIYYQAFISGNQVQTLDSGRANPLVSYAFKLRRTLVAKFVRYLADKDAASVASTLILGYRSDLSKEVFDAYSKTGTIHVLSVSGMHVGIVFIVMVFLLQFMDHSRNLRLIRAVLMIALIWFYAIITGFSPSVCRSAMMISFIIIGKALQRNQNTYNLLAISAVLLLIYDPLFLFDVGFQLSYLSVVGLVYLYPRVNKLFYFKYRLADQLWSYISVSIAAQLATFPLSMYYFHQFPVYFLVSNIFIIIPVAFIMYAGLLFLFIPWDAVLSPLGWLLNKSIIFTNKGLFYIEHLPFANIEGIWISAWTYLTIYAFIFLIVFAFLYKSKALVYSALIVSLILLVSNSVNNIAQLENHQIIFYSLRKNTGIGFINGKDAVIITDLNKSDKTFAYAINPSLNSNGADNITTVSVGSTFFNNNLFYEGSFIQFRNRRILVWNKNFNKKTFSKRAAVDILVLQGNPQITIEFLKKSVEFKILIIDGSNMDYRVKKWQEEADAVGILYYVLKGNRAHVVKM